METHTTAAAAGIAFLYIAVFEAMLFDSILLCNIGHIKLFDHPNRGISCLKQTHISCHRHDHAQPAADRPEHSAQACTPSSAPSLSTPPRAWKIHPLECQQHFFRCYFGESSATSHTLWAGAFLRPTCTPRHFRHTQNDLQHVYCVQCASVVVSAGAFQLPGEGMVTERV